jgi:arylsulfatase A-like enzyme
MERSGSSDERGLTRRALLRGAVAVGGLIAGGEAIKALTGGSGTTHRAFQAARRPLPGNRPDRPNILVIVVDQLRFPQWLSPTESASGLPPHIDSLAEGAVTFARHYTASNDCTPARSTLLTGLYTHQTGCMITGGSTLDPGLPTYGAMLRELGYRSVWYGKWHLTRGDHHWRPWNGGRALERYGFSGGTFPSPDGAPGQGMRVDPHVAGQFAEWIRREGDAGPWCATVSLVNPHDIAWWYRFSNRFPGEATAASVVDQLPPNFESPSDQMARGKPRLQRSLQATAAASFGPVGYEGVLAEEQWHDFANLYLKLQLTVDRHVGNILASLATRPGVEANTVVVFTSDHGEYAGSHGLRGKGASAYEEGIRVPLMVKDPRGELTVHPDHERTQLTSSVDVAPLLLTIASGGSRWREHPRYEHLARRADLAAILGDPQAPGRRHVIHATDEVVTEFAAQTYSANAPLHVTAVRTAEAKYAAYSNWEAGTLNELPEGREDELYDYRDERGRLELDNLAQTSALQPHLDAVLRHAVERELREPLPARLVPAQRRGFADYFSTAKRSAVAATAARRRRTERLVGPLHDEDEALRGPAEPTGARVVRQ